MLFNTKMATNFWTLLAPLIFYKIETFGEQLISNYFEDQSELIYNGGNVTCETSATLRTSLLKCAADCGHLSWCVAFLFNSKFRTCCLLETLMTSDSGIQQDMDVRINKYLVKQQKRKCALIKLKIND